MSFDQVLDMTMELPLNEREALLDILSKRIIEERRKDLADYSKLVEKEYMDGKLKSKQVDEIISELEAV